MEDNEDETKRRQKKSRGDSGAHCKLIAKVPASSSQKCPDGGGDSAADPATEVDTALGEGVKERFGRGAKGRSRWWSVWSPVSSLGITARPSE